MDSKEFFAAVVKMRKLQKRRDAGYTIDTYTRRQCEEQERIIDTEIKRVDLVMRENSMPRFFDLTD